MYQMIWNLQNFHERTECHVLVLQHFPALPFLCRWAQHEFDAYLVPPWRWWQALRNFTSPFFKRNLGKAKIRPNSIPQPSQMLQTLHAHTYINVIHKNDKHRKTAMNVWSIQSVQASCSSPSSRSQWPWAWCSDWAAPFSRPPRATRRCSRCPWRSRACSPWRPAVAAIAPGLGMFMDVFSMC